MKVAHIARKPLEGTVASNTLKYGTGSINIDGCRVASDGSHLREGTIARVLTLTGDEREGAAAGMFRPGASFTPTNSPLGRWPANLVLIHKPGCNPSGTRKSSGYAINRWSDGAKPFGGGAGHEYSTVKTPEMTEIVWDCVPGCPALSLDEQSGDVASRFFKQVTTTSTKNST